MSARYEVGELVDVLVRNARIVESDSTSVMVEAADMDAIWLDLGAVTVTRVAPKEWPPQPGDVWLDANDSEWFGHGEGETAGLLAANGLIGGAADGALSNYGPLRLAYRRGWSPKAEAPATAAEPAELSEADKRAEKIAGMREMLAWLETRPDVPLPLLDFVDYPDHWAGGKEAGLAELLRRATAAGVEPRVSRHVYLTLASFRGGVHYDMVVCDAADLLKAKDIAGEGEEVAGPAEGSGSATAPTETAAGPPADGAHNAGTPESGGAPAAVPAPGYDGDGAAVTPDVSKRCTFMVPVPDQDHMDYCGQPAQMVMTPEGRFYRCAEHEPVWVSVARRGIEYHDPTRADGELTMCGRSMRTGQQLTVGHVTTALDAKPCPRCYGELVSA